MAPSPGTYPHAVIARRAPDHGMHRRVWLDVELHGIAVHPGDRLVLAQHLDTTAYMDVDELQAMQRAGCFESVAHSGSDAFIDVEKPSYQSKQHWVVFEREFTATGGGSSSSGSVPGANSGGASGPVRCQEGRTLPGIGAGVGAEMSCGCALAHPSAGGEQFDGSAGE